MVRTTARRLLAIVVSVAFSVLALPEIAGADHGTALLTGAVTASAGGPPVSAVVLAQSPGTELDVAAPVNSAGAYDLTLPLPHTGTRLYNVAAIDTSSDGNDANSVVHQVVVGTAGIVSIDGASGSSALELPLLVASIKGFVANRAISAPATNTAIHVIPLAEGFIPDESRRFSFSTDGNGNYRLAFGHAVQPSEHHVVLVDALPPLAAKFEAVYTVDSSGTVRSINPLSALQLGYARPGGAAWDRPAVAHLDLAPATVSGVVQRNGSPVITSGIAVFDGNESGALEPEDCRAFVRWETNSQGEFATWFPSSGNDSTWWLQADDNGAGSATTPNSIVMDGAYDGNVLSVDGRPHSGGNPATVNPTGSAPPLCGGHAIPGGEPVSVTATPVGGTTDATAAFTVAHGVVGVTVHGVGSGGATVTLSVRSDPPATGTTGIELLGVTYDITVTGASAGATICLPYTDEALDDAGLEESGLQVFHFGSNGSRELITTSVDPEGNSICGASTHFSPFAIGELATDRLAGVNRYATAASISRSRFEPGVDVAYVASGESFADALAAGPAAAADHAPVLLTTRASLPAETAAELTRLAPGRIVVLGGTGAVSEDVVAALRGRTAGSVQRVAGNDRYATAAAISATSFQPGVDVAYVASGESFADALAGGAAAAFTSGPVLLTQRDSLPASTAAELDRLHPGRIVVLGGPAAVSDAVVTAAGAFGAVQRIAGADRYATAAAVSAATFPGRTTAYVATGTAFADALAAVPAAGFDGAALLLTTPSALPASTSSELARLKPTAIAVLGGTAAIAARTESDIALHLIR